MPHWSNKFSEFLYTGQGNENGIRTNDCWGNPNTIKQLAKSTQVGLFQFLNKSVVGQFRNELILTLGFDSIPL